MELKELFTTDEKKQNAYFTFYVKLPGILAFVLFALFFLWGIIDPSVFQYGRYETHYGVMGVESAFLCWFIWVLIGAVTAVLTYFGTRIAFSYKILHITYLREIVKATRGEGEDLQENAEGNIENNEANHNI